MLKFIRIVSLVFVSAFSLPVRAGDSFNNGGGLAEGQIAFIWQNLELYVDMCRQMSECKGSTDEAALLEAVRDAASTERAASNPEFKAGRDDPGFFDEHGDVQILKTDIEVGAKIYFNLDLLYVVDPTTGITTPLSLPECLSIVFQGFSRHHQTPLTRDEIAAMGTRLAQAARSKTQTITLNNPLVDAGMQIVNIGRTAFPMLLIRDAESLFGLTEPLKAAIARVDHALDLEHLTDVKFENSRWSQDGILSGGFATFSSVMKAKALRGNHTDAVTCSFKYQSQFRRESLGAPWLYVDAESMFDDVSCQVTAAQMATSESFADNIRYGACAHDSSNCQTKAEQTFLVVRDLLAPLLDACTDVNFIGSGCDVDGTEARVIDKIWGGLASGREIGSLTFVSERTQPGFFFIDGQVRVAKTGDDVGDPIFINTDIINAATELDMGTAAAILTHEFGHHHAVMDHQVLDRIGAKIRAFMRRVGTQIDSPIGTTSWKRELTIFNTSLFFMNGLLGPTSAKAHIILWDGFDFTSLATRADAALCQSPSRPNLDKQWMGNPYFVEDEGNAVLRVRMNARYICLPDFGIGENRFNDDAEITLPFRGDDPDSPIDDSGIRATVIDCRRAPDALCLR